MQASHRRRVLMRHLVVVVGVVVVVAVAVVVGVVGVVPVDVLDVWRWCVVVVVPYT